ncbi:MAG: spheroidene monooxygenase [Chitinophagaceae bacterium]
MATPSVILSIAKYPRFMGWAGFLSMAIFRVPFWLHKQLLFWKLMGCGKNGTFDKQPDFNQWAVMLAVTDINQWQNNRTTTFMQQYWRCFGAKVTTYYLQPIEGHGLWDGKQVFGVLPKTSDYDGPIAVLTRATIKLSKLGRFWEHVPIVARHMQQTEGFITSVGIGEIPWIKQATFSVWECKAAMKNFAYKMADHADVVRKTHQEKWYSEDMFVRFKIINVTGSNLPALKAFAILQS